MLDSQAASDSGDLLLLHPPIVERTNRPDSARLRPAVLRQRLLRLLGAVHKCQEVSGARVVHDDAQEALGRSRPKPGS